MSKTYNAPKPTFVVKTRLTEEEHSFFMEQLKNYEMSQSEFIRQAIDGAVIKPIINVCPVTTKCLKCSESSLPNTTKSAAISIR